MRKFVRENAARIFALVVATLTLVMEYVPELPDDKILTVIAALIALVGGEAVQRADERKTREALAISEYRPRHRRDGV